MIYFITVNYDSAALIATLLTSIQLESDRESICYQLIIVNNSPADAALYEIASDSTVILEAGENLGFGGGCNLGLNWVYARDKEAIVWLINPDAVLAANALVTAIAVCHSQPQLSIVGAVVYEPNGKVWFAGGEFVPNSGRIVAITSAPVSADWVETAWVTGCSMLLNLRNFSSCPQFDPDYFLYYEDFDLCRRYAQQGHTIAVAPAITVIHQPSSITSRTRSRTLQHSTYSYLLALQKHTSRRVLLYRLGRIVAHALRVSAVDGDSAIAIIKGVADYVAQVSRFG